MGCMFVSEGLANPFITAIDSTLIRANGLAVWHKSSMKKGIIPCSSIDTDARWGYSHTKGWIFGYKLHLTSNASSSVIVPLSAGFTAANIPDNQLYGMVTSSLPSTTIKEIHYMTADHGYNDHKLYDLSMDLGLQIVCPIRRCRNTPVERIDLVDFYQSTLGQAIYSKRRTSIDHL